jgi:hypothetical protein
MYAWVNAALDAGRDGEQPGTGLYWDKLRGDGTVDRAQWSYNQGSMVGLNVLLARRGPGGPAYLARAEAIARRALAHYASAGYDSQPAAFNAIFFRNLLTCWTTARSCRSAPCWHGTSATTPSWPDAGAWRLAGPTLGYRPPHRR